MNFYLIFVAMELFVFVYILSLFCIKNKPYVTILLSKKNLVVDFPYLFLSNNTLWLNTDNKAKCFTKCRYVHFKFNFLVFCVSKSGSPRIQSIIKYYIQFGSGIVVTVVIECRKMQYKITPYGMTKCLIKFHCCSSGFKTMNHHWELLIKKKLNFKC